MADGFPVHSTGRWTFHLQQGHMLQFHITSEHGQSGHIHIDDHDISVLLDYLYDHREAIYEATHDEQTRRLEALEALESTPPARLQSLRVEPIRYLDEERQCM